jgi:fluoride exporter
VEATLKLGVVMLGGAVGAAARYLINVSPISSVSGKFPLPTFLINITGSFLIGFLIMALADRFAVDENLRLLIIVGFLGAFTTFSAFEIELYALARGGDYVIGALYLFLSVFAGFIGVVAGVELGRRLQ